MKKKRIDSEIKKLIALAQLRDWPRDALVARIKELWRKTEQGKKDAAKDTEHHNWMKQIGL